MENPKENIEEPWNARNIREMQEKGFELVAEEALGRDVFDSETSRFLPRLEQTEDQIKQRYGGSGKVEVELLLRPSEKIVEYLKKGLIDEKDAAEYEIPQIDRVYLVFRKPIVKSL